MDDKYYGPKELLKSGITLRLKELKKAGNKIPGTFTARNGNVKLVVFNFTDTMYKVLYEHFDTSLEFTLLKTELDAN